METIADVRILAHRNQDILPYIPHIAQLRITVFREFPYLYEGSMASEAEYLKVLARSSQSLVLLAQKGQDIVGAATGMPLGESAEAFQEPFKTAGQDIASCFYLGEFILLPAFRGQGLGSVFFDEMEHFAQTQGFSHTAFCAVDRSEDHPHRPAHYHHLPSMYHKRRYQATGLTVKLAWPQWDTKESTLNALSFWKKTLVGI